MFHSIFSIQLIFGSIFHVCLKKMQNSVFFLSLFFVLNQPESSLLSWSFYELIFTIRFISLLVIRECLFLTVSTPDRGVLTFCFNHGLSVSSPFSATCVFKAMQIHRITKHPKCAKLFASQVNKWFDVDLLMMCVLLCKCLFLTPWIDLNGPRFLVVKTKFRTRWIMTCTFLCWLFSVWTIFG